MRVPAKDLTWYITLVIDIDYDSPSCSDRMWTIICINSSRMLDVYVINIPYIWSQRMMYCMTYIKRVRDKMHRYMYNVKILIGSNNTMAVYKTYPFWNSSQDKRECKNNLGLPS